MIWIALLAAQVPPPAADPAAIARAVQPSLVHVEYMLQFDKGEAPSGGGFGERCPNCGRIHHQESGSLVKDERPLELAGFLLSPTQVIAPDPVVNPRFVKSIAVGRSRTVSARIAAVLKAQPAVLLELSEPLPDGRALAFDAEKKSPYFAVSWSKAGGTWTSSVGRVSSSVSWTESGRRFVAVPSSCLVVDKEGSPVGMSFSNELAADDSWKGSPLSWPAVPAAEMENLLARLREEAGRTLVRVVLSLRSPKASEGSRAAMMMRRYRPSHADDESATERNLTGVLVGERAVLVLADLHPKTTARLERALIVGPKESVAAKFAHTLRDWGAFLVELEKPLAGAARISNGAVTSWRDRMILSAEIRQQGENRVSIFGHRRIAEFTEGWKGRTYPVLSGETAGVYLFDSETRELLALPIARRERVSDESSRYSLGRPGLVPAAYLTDALRDPAANADPSNVPLTGEQESRLAWLGVELQALTQDLARANKVSDQTKDGQTGALVTFVYPDSPAGRAGIEPGWILLRLHLEGVPQPMDVRVEQDMSGLFQWDRYDQVPEQFFERIPFPWPPAENSLNRALTDLGFGRKFKAEFFRDGSLVVKDFEVAPSPPHHDSAARWKAEALGLTVRDLTYEVRRYFQKKPDDPGVILSKIEQGGKASVAGLKPYEVVESVNDEPVRSVKDFERLVGGQEELRLFVKRMLRGRLVKIRLK